MKKISIGDVAKMNQLRQVIGLPKSGKSSTAMEIANSLGDPVDWISFGTLPQDWSRLTVEPVNIYLLDGDSKGFDEFLKWKSEQPTSTVVIDELVTIALGIGLQKAMGDNDSMSQNRWYSLSNSIINRLTSLKTRHNIVVVQSLRLNAEGEQEHFLNPHLRSQLTLYTDKLFWCRAELDSSGKWVYGVERNPLTITALVK